MAAPGPTWVGEKDRNSQKITEGKNIFPNQFLIPSKHDQKTPLDTIYGCYDWDGETIMGRVRTKQAYFRGVVIAVESSHQHCTILQRPAPNQPTLWQGSIGAQGA